MNLIRLYFLKRLHSAGWSRQLRRSAGSQTLSIMVCPFLQGAEHDRESVDPTKMKLYPGFHNPFASCLLLCSSSYFGAKKRSLLQIPQGQAIEESHALWCTKLHKLCRNISWWCINPLQAPACCIWWRSIFLAHFRCKRNWPRRQKKQQKNKNGNKQSIHARKTH